MYNKKLVFAAACLGILLFGVGIITLGSIAPELRADFQLNAVQTGFLFSILPVGILTGSLVFGPVGDRYGYRLLLACCCLALGSGFQGIVYATSTTWLHVSVFLVGCGGGAINGATSAAVADMSGHGKGANLSLMGIFFGLGALGMPFFLGMMKGQLSYQVIVGGIGWLTLGAGICFLFIRFPPPKAPGAFSFSKAALLSKERLLLAVGFFLFCQSSFEALINNWTTTYLAHQGISASKALFALSTYIGGYTVMRLLTGTLLRSVSFGWLMFGSLALAFCGVMLLIISTSLATAVAGLILIGFGLSGGFPLMLGFVGERFASLSGTAFSFVLVIGLTGNMLVNYLVGLVAASGGIHYLSVFLIAECAAMLGLLLLIRQYSKRALPK